MFPSMWQDDISLAVKQTVLHFKNMGSNEVSGEILNKLCKIVTNDADNFEKLLIECQVDKNVKSFIEFEEDMNLQREKIQAEISDDIEEEPSIDDLSEYFTRLSECPKCFQKPIIRRSKDYKPTISKKDKNTNITIAGNSTNTAAIPSAPAKNTSNKSADEMFKEYLKLKNDCTEIEQKYEAKQDTLKEYNAHLGDLEKFLKGLEDLLPEDTGESEDAFTAEEITNIQELKETVDSFIYLQENKNLFATTETNVDEDLDSIVKLGTDLLQNITIAN